MHKSGKNVMKMGCIEDVATDSCKAKDTCLDPKHDSVYEHHFCCCTNDLCNVKFKTVEAQPKPTKPYLTYGTRHGSKIPSVEKPLEVNEFSPTVCVIIIVSAFLAGIIFALMILNFSRIYAKIST